MTDAHIETLAEDALLVRFGDTIDAALNAQVHAAAHALREAGIAGVTDIAPAYASLLVRFDPGTTSIAQLRAQLDAAIAAAAGAARDAGCTTDACTPRTLEIPVCYGGTNSDLDAIATHAHLTPAEIIARHTAATYTVAMLGFAPGFPYLLGLDPALHMPRRANPRTHVPAGSVAIGGAQTGIYPSVLPGGWHLLGRTPVVLFDPQREPPCLLAPGDHVRFRAIDADEFAASRSASDAD